MGELKMKKIFFVASEAQPFFASGGLGDVIGSLPKKIVKNAKDKFSVSVIVTDSGRLMIRTISVGRRKQQKAFSFLLFVSSIFQYFPL